MDPPCLSCLFPTPDDSFCSVNEPGKSLTRPVIFSTELCTCVFTRVVNVTPQEGLILKWEVTPLEKQWGWYKARLYAKGLSAKFGLGGMYAEFYFTIWKNGEWVIGRDGHLPKCTCLPSLITSSKRSLLHSRAPETGP